MAAVNVKINYQKSICIPLNLNELPRTSIIKALIVKKLKDLIFQCFKNFVLNYAYMQVIEKLDLKSCSL